MPIDITTFVMLEKTTGNGWPGGRNITHIISLDEGHDRAYWQWVKHPKRSQFRPSSVWLPERIDTALRDGLLMLISDGLGDESLQALIPHERGSFGRVDLSRRETLDAEIVACFPPALAGYKINVVSFPDSSVKAHDFPGLEMHVLQQSDVLR